MVEATLDVIAQKGFSGTSVSAIIEPASLSRGMIHLHFGGKDNLVEKAARHSSEVDFSGLDSALAQSGNSQQAADRRHSDTRDDQLRVPVLAACGPNGPFYGPSIYCNRNRLTAVLPNGLFSNFSDRCSHLFSPTAARVIRQAKLQLIRFPV
ncbi:MAG: AcrR family transcriptional regulator [Gammaproteobacteria bacterium]